MKRTLLYLWQLPQNLLGFLVLNLLDAYKPNFDFDAEIYLHYKTFFSSVFLGNFIILNGYAYTKNTIRHEQGHQKQSLYLGWLYLIIIGLPSICGNIYDKIAHKKWPVEARTKWYYSQHWEAWADKLGGVKR